MNNYYKTFGLFIVLAITILGCNSTTTEAYNEKTVDKETQKHVAKEIQKPTGKKAPVHGVITKISHTEDEVSIAQIFADPASFENKTVKVRGTVVKVNEQIMGKNWIHIQDGTEHDGSFDLTITTGELVKKGSVTGFEGTIILNKDFGYGYVYDVIMENATVESTTQL